MNSLESIGRTTPSNIASIRRNEREESPAFPTPHLDKLIAARDNGRLPEEDRPRINAAICRYWQWMSDLEAVRAAGEDVLGRMVQLLNEYRTYIDVELIFDSPREFLLRQKGQLKLDGSVIEEFLPHLTGPALLPELQSLDVQCGPATCFLSSYLSSSLAAPQQGGGLAIRSKNQDFAIAKPVYIRSSHTRDFKDPVQHVTLLSYLTVECKTNLDKTMFQEACATAHDTKSAVAGSRYYLLCEWLDMPPLNTAATDIDEVIILRKAKRLSANMRMNFWDPQRRHQYRSAYLDYLACHPFQEEMFSRFVNHIRELIRYQQPDEQIVLERGYF